MLKLIRAWKYLSHVYIFVVHKNKDFAPWNWANINWIYLNITSVLFILSLNFGSFCEYIIAFLSIKEWDNWKKIQNKSERLWDSQNGFKKPWFLPTEQSHQFSLNMCTSFQIYLVWLISKWYAKKCYFPRKSTGVKQEYFR